VQHLLVSVVAHLVTWHEDRTVVHLSVSLVIDCQASPMS